MEVISILDVVNAIASRVPTPPAWKDGVLIREQVPIYYVIDRSGRAARSERLQAVKISFLNGLFLTAYRTSEAAGALDYFLDEVGENGPKWLDWGHTGWPKKATVAARDEGLAILAHMARHFDRCEEAYQSGQFDDWPRSDNVPRSKGRFAKPEDLQRSKEIGFDRTELLRFLERHGIAHDLGEATACVAPNEESQGIASRVSKPLNSEEGEVERPNAQAENPDQEKKLTVPTGGVTVRRTGGRRHPLADLIEKAQDQAGDQREDEKEVYPILIRMAESGQYPRLHGFVPKKGIEYWTGEVSKFYTQNALAKYLHPEKRGKRSRTSLNKNKKLSN